VKGQSPAYKLPLTLAQIRDMRDHLDLDSLPDLQLWCVILACFFGLLRISNITCQTSSKWDPNKTLLRKHVTFYKQGCVMNFLWSKTIQYRQRAHEVPLPFISDKAMCPASALLRLITEAGPLPDSSPVLSYSCPDGLVMLPTPAGVRKRLRHLLQAIGITNVAECNTHTVLGGVVLVTS